jgi:DNA-binding MarR family transcriptional regulator
MIQKIDIEFASELRNVITRLIKKLRKESPTSQGLSMTERSTMALLQQHNRLLPNELAAMEMITNQSMSQVLNHLYELGYIIRAASETDKRKINISLSEKGEETLALFRHERDEWIVKAIENTCSAKEQAMLKQIIGPLTKIVDYK